MTSSTASKRTIHHPGKMSSGHRSRKAARMGKAWTTSPSELGLMMQTREGSSRASRRGECVRQEGTPFPMCGYDARWTRG